MTFCTNEMIAVKVRSVIGRKSSDRFFLLMPINKVLLTFEIKVYISKNS